jgi:hypothetical protein
MLYVRIRPKFALPHEERDRTFEYLKARPSPLTAYPKNPFKITSYLYSSVFICVHLWFQIS